MSNSDSLNLMENTSVGRIVHFQDNKEGAKCIAAIITETHENNVISLTLFAPFKTGPYFARVGFRDSENPLETMAGSWHWPERI